MAQPLPLLSAALLARLQAYGEFSYHQPALLGRWIGVPAEVEWDSPAGLEAAPFPVAITLWFPAGKRGLEDLHRLLDALDDFRRHLAEHIADLHSHVLLGFRDGYERELAEVVRDRLRGGTEAITDAAILREITAAHYRFDATGKAIVRTAAMQSQWSGEDGLVIEWDAPSGAAGR